MLKDGLIVGYFTGISLAAAIMLVASKIPVNNILMGIFLGTVITIFIIGILEVIRYGDYISLTREELLDLLDGKLLSQEGVDKLVEKLTD